jgi:hypothetical protein
LEIKGLGQALKYWVDKLVMGSQTMILFFVVYRWNINEIWYQPFLTPLSVVEEAGVPGENH